MKVLIISFFNGWVTHLGTELELAQIHLDNGDEVEFLGCDGCIAVCQNNPYAAKDLCDTCRLRRSRGIQLLSPQPVEHRLGDYLPNDAVTSEELRLGAITDAESARSFQYNGHDLGWGALSSTMMVLRDPVCESEEAKELLKRYAKSALRSYLAVKAFLKARKGFDRVYIFNGRFASTRSVLRACEEQGGIEIMIHERGSSVHKYELFGNSMPHSRDWWHRQFESSWASATDSTERNATGRAFYEARRHGSPADWKSFITAQEVGLLPSGWNAAKRNVVIFNSSEDELAGIGEEWRNPIYPMQSEGIRRILCDALDRYPDAHFYVRMHPNLAGLEFKDVKMLHALASPNLTLIEPTSKISSYTLLAAAERVITFGSTMGIEASYWGKVSILAGHSFYEKLDAVYAARDHEHVMDLLGANLEPKPLVNAIKYGYCLQTFGRPFRYWQPDGFEDGCFRGTSLSWMPATNLERKVLIRCLDLGLRSEFLQKVIHSFSQIAAYRHHIRRAIAPTK